MGNGSLVLPIIILLVALLIVFVFINFERFNCLILIIRVHYFNCLLCQGISISGLARELLLGAFLVLNFLQEQHGFLLFLLILVEIERLVALFWQDWGVITLVVIPYLSTWNLLLLCFTQILELVQRGLPVRGS